MKIIYFGSDLFSNCLSLLIRKRISIEVVFINDLQGKVKYFDKEDISQPYPHFSDEYLLRVLIEEWAGEVIHIPRNVDIRTQWIDRSWWSIDSDKLNAGQYVTCNFLRNMRDQFSQIKPVADYIYGKSVDIEDVTL